jgi:hypothetical protein
MLLVATWLQAATSGQGRAFGPGNVPYVLVTTGTLAVALWGLWRMRPWAFWALPAAMVLDDAVVWAMGELRPGVGGADRGGAPGPAAPPTGHRVALSAPRGRAPSGRGVDVAPPRWEALGPMPAAFAVTSLHKRFRTRFGRTESVALDGVDLQVPRGEAFGLIGPNGAGKTTFIKCLLGIAHPDSGAVELLGGRPEDPRSRARVGYSRSASPCLGRGLHAPSWRAWPG